MYISTWKITIAIIFLTLYTLTWLEEHRKYNQNK